MIVVTIVTVDRAILLPFNAPTPFGVAKPFAFDEITVRSFVEASNETFESVILVLGPLIVIPINSGAHSSSFL